MTKREYAQLMRAPVYAPGTEQAKIARKRKINGFLWVVVAIVIHAIVGVLK